MVKPTADWFSAIEYYINNLCLCLLTQISCQSVYKNSTTCYLTIAFMSVMDDVHDPELALQVLL